MTIEELMKTERGALWVGDRMLQYRNDRWLVWDILELLLLYSGDSLDEALKVLMCEK